MCLVVVQVCWGVLSKFKSAKPGTVHSCYIPSHGTKTHRETRHCREVKGPVPGGQVNKARTLPLTETLGHSGIVEEYLVCCNIKTT